MKTYRIDIVDEETGTVVQQAPGISEERMQAFLRVIGQVGQLAGDFKTIRDAWNRTFGRGRSS